MARPKLDPSEKRQRLDVWLTPDERRDLAARSARSRLPLRTYVRAAALGRRLAEAPSVANVRAYGELARLAANLNQVAHRANVTGELPADLAEQLAEANGLLAEVRAALLGGGDPDDPEDQ